MASPKYVGAERSFVELSNELAKNEEVIALVVKGCEYKDKFSQNVHVIELAANPSRYNPFLYREIFKILKEQKPDIVHTHSAKATQIMYKLWKLKKFRFVATKRNTKKNKVFDKVPAVVAVSQEVANQIKNKNKYIIYNGIEPKTIQEQKESKFTIIAVGALRKVKNFDGLIEGVLKLPFDFQLWIVGEGEERKNLERLIKQKNLQNIVKLLGYRTDIPSLLAKSHLQIISSHREGFSRALIEGLFYSDVVISTKVAGSTEILPDALLFDNVSQKIEEVYHEYDIYKEIFQKTKKQYQPLLQLDRIAQEYKELYKKALNV